MWPWAHEEGGDALQEVVVLRQVMLQHLRAVLEEAARKTSPSQMRRVCREPKAEAPRSEEMRKDGQRSVGP